MQSVIAKIRAMPEDDRRRLLVVAGGMVSIVMVGLWLFLLPLQVASVGKADEEETKDLSSSPGFVKGMLGNALADVQRNLREIAARLEQDKRLQAVDHQSANEAGIPPTALP